MLNLLKMRKCVTINPQIKSIPSYDYKVNPPAFMRLVLKLMNNLQVQITVSIPYDLHYFYIFIYNKDQMYLPKIDQVFGSYYLLLRIPQKYIGTGHCLAQEYKLGRTHWKTLDKESNRCDEVKTEAKTTECITRYMEKNLKCSMGLQGSDGKIKRYHFFVVDN